MLSNIYMSKYLFILLFFNSIFCIEYEHLEKGKNAKFYLDENPNKGLYLTYSDVFEEDDKAKGNNLYFLKISNDLKVNCIVQKEKPDDDSFNITTITEISEICQSSIDVYSFKLIPFPKNLAKDENIYFIFFFEKDKNGLERPYLTAKPYYVIRISFPKPLEVKDEPYEIKIRGEETSIYLLKHEPENYNILSSFGEFDISIFGYKDKKFEKIGKIEENNCIFQLNEESNLDNDFAYVIFDNEFGTEQTVRISFKFKIQLFTLNFRGVSEKVLTHAEFKTNLALLQIINKDKKLLKINFDHDYFLRVLDVDYNNLDNILDESFYKYIPPDYLYKKEYEFFLVFPGYGKKGVSFETYDLTETPTEIEMNKFVYFKIPEFKELKFKVNYPKNNIILKLISDNTGNVIIGGDYYPFSNENNIYIINNEEEELTIKGRETELILAIKSEIPDEFITYAIDKENYPVSFKNNEGFLAVNIDYKNHDYVSFYLRDENFKRKYPKSTDFGFLTKNDYSINEFIESDSTIYDLKYYRKNSNGRNLTKLYYINNINETSKIKISTIYYTDFKLEYNKFHKIVGNYIAKIYKNYRLFLITKTFGSAFLECASDAYGISFTKHYPFDIQDYHYNCYAQFELEDGYIYAQPIEDDKEYKEYYYDEFSLLNTVNITTKNKTHIEVSFRYNFTQLTEYNFTFIITENKNEKIINKTITDIFELFYLNKTYQKELFEIYTFNIKNTKNDGQNATIYLEKPTKFDITKKDEKFLYTLISESSPVKMFQIYNVKAYEIKDDDSNSTTLVVVSVVVGVLVLAIVAFLIIRCLRKKSGSSLDRQMEENKELTLPMTE